MGTRMVASLFSSTAFAWRGWSVEQRCLSAFFVSSFDTGLVVWTHFLPVFASSTNTSTQCFFLKSRMKRGSQSSEAIPRSLQHRMRAFDFAPSEAVAIPLGSKYSCSPRAVATNLRASSGEADLDQQRGHLLSIRTCTHRP